MKFASLATAVIALALPTLAQVSVSYDTKYDDPSFPLTSVACSDGINGLINKGYSTVGSLPSFPYVGGAYTIDGWNSPACGTCYQLTFNNHTINVTAIDVALDGFNLAEAAMNALTGGLAVDLGRVSANSTQINASFCGL